VVLLSRQPPESQAGITALLATGAAQPQLYFLEGQITR